MERYFFLHIPKTAGTSLFRVFQDVLGTENVAEPVGGDFDQLDFDALERFQMIGGHVSFDQLACFGPRRLLTILRHPVDHVLSLYYYRRSVKGWENDQKLRLSKELPLSELLRLEEGDRLKFYFNATAWQIAGLGARGHAADEKDVLVIAKEHLAQCEFVGIFEQMEDSLDLMSYTFGWPSVKTIPLENANTARPPVANLSAEERQRIVGLSQMDMQLYDYGLSLFASRKRAMMRAAVQMRYGGPSAAPDQSPDAAPSRGVAITEARSRVESLTVIGTSAVRVVHAEVRGESTRGPCMRSGDVCLIRAWVWSDKTIDDVTVALRITNRFGQILFGCRSTEHSVRISVCRGNLYQLAFRMKMALVPNHYRVDLRLFKGRGDPEEVYDIVETAAEFVVSGFRGPHFRGVVDLAPEISLLDAGSEVDVAVCEPGRTIMFNHSGNGRKYFLGGWSQPEEWGCWTDGPEAHLLMRLARLPADRLRASFTLHAFCPEQYPEMNVDVILNGMPLTTWHIAGEEEQRLHIDAPASLVTNSSVFIAFRIFHPRVPATFGHSPDSRRLGLAFTRMTIIE